MSKAKSKAKHYYDQTKTNNVLSVSQYFPTFLAYHIPAHLIFKTNLFIFVF